MLIHVLGSAAGGGFPQWNCNCSNCDGFRKGTLNARARTQSSIAVSEDGEHWILFNASPDIRAQLAAFPAMQPARALRDTGISAVLLIDSQVDHTTGLLTGDADNADPVCSKSSHHDRILAARRAADHATAGIDELTYRNADNSRMFFRG